MRQDTMLEVQIENYSQDRVVDDAEAAEREATHPGPETTAEYPVTASDSRPSPERDL